MKLQDKIETARSYVSCAISMRTRISEAIEYMKTVDKLELSQLVSTLEIELEKIEGFERHLSIQAQALECDSTKSIDEIQETFKAFEEYAILASKTINEAANSIRSPICEPH